MCKKVSHKMHICKTFFNCLNSSALHVCVCVVVCFSGQDDMQIGINSSPSAWTQCNTHAHTLFAIASMSHPFAHSLTLCTHTYSQIFTPSFCPSVSSSLTLTHSHLHLISYTVVLHAVHLFFGNNVRFALTFASC